MGLKLIQGINDLESWCKSNDKVDLLDEWDPSNEILPCQISYGSHKKVKWICKNGHHYEKDIHSRCQGTGCSSCSGISFVHRDLLFEEHPELISEIDEAKNTYDMVKNISTGSSKQIYWKCENGHSYKMSPSKKEKSKDCPICNNRRLLVGANDLETWCKNNGRQQILSDWDDTKNTFSPKDIVYGSNKKVWFKCHICGYEWRTVLYSRTLQHCDCRMCTVRVRSSFPEQCIFFIYLNAFLIP